jgi:G3E family GTPase
MEAKADDSINECIRQIALADRLVLNKTDLVTNAELSELEELVRSVNAFAPRLKTTKSKYALISLTFHSSVVSDL